MDTTLSRHISPTAWRGYSALDTDAFIRSDFMRRYGVYPEEVRRKMGCATVLAGPVPSAELCQNAPQGAEEEKG